jgi:hypothetical protein
MEFSYSNLRSMAISGEQVGRWSGSFVFACSKTDLKNKGTGAFFILYDDNNILVKKKSDEKWYMYGTISKNGSVNEFENLEVYRDFNSKSETEKETHAVCGKNEAECNGEMEIENEVIGDVKLGIDVDKMLEAARTMTVNSLLEGFNYGLVEEVVG